MANQKAEKRQRIKYRIRKKLQGTAERPRLSVFRSNTNIYVQLIDDLKGHTLVATSTIEIKGKENKTCTLADAKAVGSKIAEKALAAGLNAVVFDRNGFVYHGKVKALAEGAREGGLTF